MTVSRSETARRRPRAIFITARAFVGAALFIIASPRDAAAVIPGLAPSLVAILPQLVLISFATLALLVSPRAWWRIAVRAAKHPLRAAGIVSGGLAIGFAACEVARLVPRAVAGPELPVTVAGFTIGDRRAAGTFEPAVGPLRAPELRTLAIQREPQARFERLVALGRRLGLVTAAPARLVSIDMETEASWTFAPDANGSGPPRIAAGPLPIERRSSEGGSSNAVAVVLVSSSRAAAGDARPETKGSAGSELVLLDAGSGSTLSRTSLGAISKGAALALVDERILVALDDNISCYTLATHEEPELLWRRTREPEGVVGLAGDEAGRYFLLDRRGLYEGSLDGRKFRALAEPFFAGGREPLSFALREGRLFIAAEDQHGFVLAAFDPARRDHRLLWEYRPESASHGEFSVAPFGVVVTEHGGIAVVDSEIGERKAWFETHSPPAAPAAVTGTSAFVVTRSGVVIRIAATLGETTWDAKLPAATGDSEQPADLEEVPLMAVVGRELVIASLQTLHAVAERTGGEPPPWSQWRSGPDRSGATDPAELPLDASVLWTCALDGTSGREPDRERANGNESRAPPVREGPPETVHLLPLLEGLLAARFDGTRTLAFRVDAAGTHSGSLELDGEVLGIVREGHRAVLALARGKRDLLVCLEVPSDTETIDEIWSVPVRSFAETAPIASYDGELFVALEQGLCMFSSKDGIRTREWPSLKRAHAPLIAQGILVAATRGDGETGGALAAIDLATKEFIWKLDRPGASFGAPSARSGEIAVVESDDQGRARLLGIDLGSGKQLREKEGVPQARGPLLASDAGVCYATREGALFREGASLPITTAVGGERKATPSVTAPPVYGFGMIIVARGSTVEAFDSQTLDPIWSVAVPASIEELVAANGHIFAASQNSVFCLGVEE